MKDFIKKTHKSNELTNRESQLWKFQLGTSFGHFWRSWISDHPRQQFVRAAIQQTNVSSSPSIFLQIKSMIWMGEKYERTIFDIYVTSFETYCMLISVHWSPVALSYALIILPKFFQLMLWNVVILESTGVSFKVIVHSIFCPSIYGFILSIWYF